MKLNVYKIVVYYYSFPRSALINNLHVFQEIFNDKCVFNS